MNTSPLRTLSPFELNWVLFWKNFSKKLITIDYYYEIVITQEAENIPRFNRSKKI